MNWLTEEQLQKIPFKRLGSNVLISKDARIYRPELMDLGSNVRVDDFCVLSGKIVIGNYVHIACFSALTASIVYPIVLEDYVTLAPGVRIFSISDDYSGEGLTSVMIPWEYRRPTQRLEQELQLGRDHC